MKNVLTKNNLKDIGRLLSGIRNGKNISQAEVGKRMKRQQCYISIVEGSRNPPNIPSLSTLVNYLDAVGYQLIIQEKV